MGIGRDCGTLVPHPHPASSPAARTAATSSRRTHSSGPALRSLGAWSPIEHWCFSRISPVPPTAQGREPASRWDQCPPRGWTAPQSQGARLPQPVLALGGRICSLSQGARWTCPARPPLPRVPAVTQPGAAGPQKAGSRRAAACARAGKGVGASPGSPGLGPSPGVPRAELPHQLEPPAALLVAWLSHFSPGAGGVGGATQFLCKAARGFPEPGAVLSPAQGRGLPRDGASPGTGASLSCRVRRGLHGTWGCGKLGRGLHLQGSRHRGQGAGLCSPGLTGVGLAGPDLERSGPQGKGALRGPLGAGGGH